MQDFIIQAKNNKVRAYRVINKALEPINFAGETTVNLADFWQAFKQKIEYCTGENIALVIMADHSSFVVDTEITIAEAFQHKKEDILYLIEDIAFAGASFDCYPSLDLTLTIKQVSAPIVDLIDKNDELPELSSGSSLQAFYRKKTRKYKTG